MNCLFLTEMLPSHSGHGGKVYPHFVLEQLKQEGFHFNYVVPANSLSRPYLRHQNAIVPGWKHLGNVALSKRVYDWASWINAISPARVLRQKLRQLPPLQKRPPQSVENLDSLQSQSKQQSWQQRNPETSRAVDDTLNHYLLAAEPQVLMANFPYLLGTLHESVLHRHYVVAITHDVIHQRSKLYQQQGWQLDFTPLRAEDEFELLELADLVVSISDADHDHFATHLPVDTTTCFPPIFAPTIAPTFAPAQPRPELQPTELQPTELQQSSAYESSNQLRCLFVGSGAEHNRTSLHWLLDAWPAAPVGKHGHRLSLDIVGSVCNVFSQQDLASNVNLLGRVPDIADAYRGSDLAFAIVTAGSGVKMKLLEALRFGTPVVTTSEGLRGLPVGAADVFPIVNNPTEITALLQQLSDTPEALAQLGVRQRDWANQHLNPRQLVRALAQRLAQSQRHDVGRPMHQSRRTTETTARVASQ